MRGVGGLRRRREPLEHPRGARGQGGQGRERHGLPKPEGRRDRPRPVPPSGRRARPGVPQTARPRSKRGDRQRGRLREVAGAALEQHPVAGDERRAWPRGSWRRPRRSAAGRPRAGRCRRRRGRSAGRSAWRGVKPGSASRSKTRPKRRSGVQISSPVNAASCEPARRPRRGRPRRSWPCAGCRPSRGVVPRRARLVDHVVELGREREQERQPRRVLDVGRLVDRGERAGRLEAGVRGGDGDRQPLGVGRRPQARHERVAIAVVGRADELAGDEPAARASAARLPWRRPWRRFGVFVAPGLRTVT